MRTNLLLGLAALLCSSASAQTFQWTAVADGAYSRGFASVTDALGNVYVCGNVNGETDFDPGPAVVPLGADGSNGDIFLVKYGPDGRYRWHVAVGGTSTEIPGDLCLDHSGGVLMTGYTSSFFDWDPGPDTRQIYPLGYNDAFIAKYDTAGQFQWVHQMGSSLVDEATGVTVDDADNVFVTGFFGADADFDDGPNENTLDFEGGVQDSFLAKFSPAGELLWVKGLQGAGTQMAASVARGEDNVLYVTGHYVGSTMLGAAPTGTLTGANGEGFLAKYTPAGDLIWAKTFGGTMNDFPEVVLADGVGRVYLYGRFGGTADLDPGPDVAQFSTAGSDYEAFFAQLDTSGSADWVHTLQANVYTLGTGDIAYDADGNVFLTGNFDHTIDMDSGPGETLIVPPFPNDHFLAKFDNTGTFRWVRTIITGSVFDTADAVATDANGNAFVSGMFSYTIECDPTAPNGILDVGDHSCGYVAKYGVDLTTEVPGNSANSFGMQVYPNPATDQITVLSGSTAPPDRLEVLDASGRVVLLWTGRVPTRVHVSMLSPGVYSIALRAAGQWAVQRFVVAR